MTIVKLAGAVVAVVVLLFAAVLTIGIPPGIMTSAIGARVERDTGFRIEFGGATRIALWPAFRLTLNDVTLERHGGTEAAERVELATTRVEMPLANLWSGSLAITELALERPAIYLPLRRERATKAAAPCQPAFSSPSTSLRGRTKIDVPKKSPNTSGPMATQPARSDGTANRTRGTVTTQGLSLGSTG